MHLIGEGYKIEKGADSNVSSDFFNRFANISGKTLRFPVMTLKQIEKVIEDRDVTFTNFVIQACEYALANMDTSEENEKEKE